MPEFRAIHTVYALTLFSRLQAEGGQMVLAEIAVGDGAGAAVTPNEDQTKLRREIYRAAIDRIYQPDPVGFPRKFAASIFIPATVAGFVMREVGVFDESGNLIVVGNTPEIEKPYADDGSIMDSLVRVEFMVSNAEAINITVDATVAVATRSWVEAYVDERLAGLTT